MASTTESDQTSGNKDLSSSKSIFETFAHHITLPSNSTRMTFSHGSNKSKELSTLTSHKLHHHVSPAISTHCLTVANQVSNTENPTYLAWE